MSRKLLPKKAKSYVFPAPLENEQCETQEFFFIVFLAHFFFFFAALLPIFSGNLKKKKKKKLGGSRRAMRQSESTYLRVQVCETNFFCWPKHHIR